MSNAEIIAISLLVFIAGVFIADIKQALKDEGYKQFEPYDIEALRHTGVITKEMTGAEFYERFKAEADNVTYLVRGDLDKVEYITRENIDLAARRAAGLEEGNSHNE